MKLDRGIIKWQPFDSVTPSKKMIDKLLNEKLKINKPILSEEQLNSIQNGLFEAYNNEIITTIEYYKNGYILKEIGKIATINPNVSKVIINNKTIYFNQIVKITN